MCGKTAVCTLDEERYSERPIAGRLESFSERHSLRLVKEEREGGGLVIGGVLCNNCKSYRTRYDTTS